MQVARPFLHQHLSALVKSFYEAPESEIILDVQWPYILAWQQGWGTRKRSKDIVPKVKLIKSGELEKGDLEKIQRKLDIFIEKKIKTL